MSSHDEESVRRRNPSSDRHARWLLEWNRVFLLVCAAGLVVDPLFFYSLSISGACMCLFVDGWFAVIVTALRCMADAVHLLNMCLQMSMAYNAMRRSGAAEKDGSRSTATRGYLRTKTVFVLDLFIILPVPQVVLWIVAPAMIRKGMTTPVMTVFLTSFLSQYLPKVYHSVCFLRRLQNLLGYILGTIWGEIALNLTAYFVASHAASACWYLLGIQRATKCLEQQCMVTSGCRIRTMACADPVYYGTTTSIVDGERMAWAQNLHARSMCLDRSDNFEYGSYKWVVTLVSNPNRLEKILFPIFWGLMTLSTFGTILSTTEWLEITFNIIIVTSALLLVTTLIRNIEVFLHATTSKKQALQSRMRILDRWMRRRNLRLEIRKRITGEGDPVQKMLFVVRGHLQSSQVLRDGVKSYCTLGPGNFSGDELLSWCLRRPSVDRLPPSSSTLVAVEPTEAFGLDVADLRYVTQHFRHTFVSEKVKRSARYYSSGWRTWAAVAIQLAWWRHRLRLTVRSLSLVRPRWPPPRSSLMEENRLRQYTALLTSPKPNHHDFAVREGDDDP